jgi:hypothetical protein
VLLELGDFVPHAGGIVILPEPDTPGGVAGPGAEAGREAEAGRKTLGLRIALFDKGRGMNMLIPIID